MRAHRSEQPEQSQPRATLVLFLQGQVRTKLVYIFEQGRSSKAGAASTAHVGPVSRCVVRLRQQPYLWPQAHEEQADPGRHDRKVLFHCARSRLNGQSSGKQRFKLAAGGGSTVHRIIDVDHDYRHRDAQSRDPLLTRTTRSAAGQQCNRWPCSRLVEPLTHPGVQTTPLMLVPVCVIASDANGKDRVRQQRSALRRPALHPSHIFAAAGVCRSRVCCDPAWLPAQSSRTCHNANNGTWVTPCDQ